MTEQKNKKMVYGDFLEHIHNSGAYNSWTQKQKETFDDIVLGQKASEGRSYFLLSGNYDQRWSQLMLVFETYCKGIEMGGNK